MMILHLDDSLSCVASLSRIATPRNIHGLHTASWVVSSFFTILHNFSGEGRAGGGGRGGHVLVCSRPVSLSDKVVACGDTQHEGDKIETSATPGNNYGKTLEMTRRAASSPRPQAVSVPKAPVVVIRRREDVQPQRVDLGVDRRHPPSHFVVILRYQEPRRLFEVKFCR